MAGRGTYQWVALDAGTGALTARKDLGTAGHGGSRFLHPVGGMERRLSDTTGHPVRRRA